MTAYASNIRRHVVNTVGFTFTFRGLYRYMELPDLAALIAPRAALVMNGSKDNAVPTGWRREGVREDRVHAFARPVCPSVNGAAGTMSRTSSIATCRPKRGNGLGARV